MSAWKLLFHQLMYENALYGSLRLLKCDEMHGYFFSKPPP
jgi:hypothetical protein